MSAMIEKDRGFVIRRHNFRETSLIATIYTASFGKIQGIFKGFYTGKREFSSPLNPGSLNEFVFYPKRSEIWLISHVDLIRDYDFLRKDTAKAHSGWLFCHFVDKVMQLWDANTFIFELLKQCLGALEQENNLKIIYIFLIKFFTYAGFKPEFNQCVGCKEHLKQEHFFSAAKGGFICPRCATHSKSIRPISLEASRSLAYIQNADFDLVYRLNVSKPCEEELLLLLKEYMSYHFEFDLLKHISKYRPTVRADSEILFSKERPL